MSSGRIKLTDAIQAAEQLVATLTPACEQIAIAGSIRRWQDREGRGELIDPQTTVGDIEIVAVPIIRAGPTVQMGLFGERNHAVAAQHSHLDEALLGLIARRRAVRDVPEGIENTPAWGERYKKLWLVGRGGNFAQVDVFIVRPPAQWGPEFVIRTGPGEFNVALMRHINQNTPLQQADGCLIQRETGEVIDTPDEASYFAAVRLPVLAPGERSATAILRATGSTRAEQQVASGNGFQMTTVANIRDLPEHWQHDERFVYVGRGNAARGLRGHALANPYKIGPDGSRNEVIEKYSKRLERRPDLQAMIPKLTGKVLVCWCHPAACHADVIADLANQFSRGEWEPVPLDVVRRRYRRTSPAPRKRV